MEPNLKTWRARVFAATWLSYFGYYFCRKPFYLTKASLESELGWDAEFLGYVGTAYLVAYSVGQFLAGFLGDRFGPRAVLLTGMMVTICANAAFGFTNSAGVFIGLMVLNGLSQATGWSNNVGTMASWFHRGERGTVMGVWSTNFQVGGVAANTITAWAGGMFGFRWSYFAGSLVLLAVWAFFLFNQRNHPKDLGLPSVTDPAGPKDASGASVEEVDPGWTPAVVTNVLLVGLFYFGAKFIRYALWSWAPYLLQKNYDLAGDDAGYLSTVFDLSGIAGVVLIGVMADKLFKGRLALIALIFVCGLIGSCVLMATLGQQSLTLFTISMGLIGFTLYGPDALMTGAGAIDVGSAKRAALASGIINGLGSIGSVAQELLLGKLLKSSDQSAVFLTLLASAVLSALSLTVLVVRNRAAQRRQTTA